MNNTSSYSKWVAKQPVVEKLNGTHEFVLPTLRDNILTEQSKVSTPRARLMVSQERVEAENAFDDIVFEYDAKERKEEKSYIVSLRAQRELASYEAGDMSPVSKERAELLNSIKLVADREDVSIEDIKRPEAVCEALEYVSRPYLPEKEHNRLEREGGLEEELLKTEASELLWLDAEDADKLDEWNALEHKRRTADWLKGQNTLNEKQFLVFFVIPEFGIKLNKVWTFMDGKRELATWGSWTKARYHVFMRIVKKANPAFDTSCSFPELKAEVKRICDEHGFTMNMNMCDMERQERKLETKTLVFGVQRALTQPTRYADYSKEVDLTGEDGFAAPNSKFKRFIVANAEGVSKAAPLTGYELESQVIRGNFDSEDLIASTFEHPDDEDINAFVPAYEEQEMTHGENAYVSFWSIRGRFDLADALMGVDDDKRVAKDQRKQEAAIMLPELAEAIWNGEFSPEAANELFGTFWNDSNGGLRRGQYLYNAFTMLLEDDFFESNVTLVTSQYMDACLDLARIDCDKHSPKHVKQAWGRQKAKMDNLRLMITLAKLLNTPFEEGHTSYNRIMKIVVNKKASDLVWRYDKAAVYGGAAE